MYRIDDNQNVASLPADPTDNVGTPGYFTGGNPSAGIPPTRVRYWWLNMIQEELCNLVGFDGTALVKDNYTQVLSAIRRMFRTRVVGGTLNLYVSTTGSDSNDGLSAATPLLTINHAIALAAANYDLTGTTVQIALAGGTYLAALVDGATIKAPIILAGAGSNLTTITSAVSHTIQVIRGATCIVSGLTITNTSSNNSDFTGGTTGILCQTGALAEIGNDVNFGSCPNGAHMWAYQGGTIAGESQAAAQGRDYKISGGATIHLFASSNGSIVVPDCTVTLVGTPAFSAAFAVAAQNASVGCWNTTYSGSATGSRYQVSGCATIETQGAGASYLPGNASGTTYTGGQYL